MKKFAVVTALLYGDKFLPSYFGALEKVNFPKEDWMIVAVYDRHTEITKKWIDENVMPKAGTALPEFRLLETDRNLGFTGNNNACIRYAMDRGCDAVYLLNEDARPDAEFLNRIGERLADPAVGVAQSLLILDPPERGVNSIGNEVHYLGWSYCGGIGMDRADAEGLLRVKKISDPDLGIPSASGAGVAVRTETLKRIGLFDEDYFNYHEDVDLSGRARLAGYKTVIVPESVVYHAYDFARSTKKIYWMERNRYRFMLEHYKIPTLVLFFPAFIAAEAGLLILSVKNKTFSRRLAAYGYILNPKNWPSIRQKRKQVQALRKISDREYLKNATGRVLSEYASGPLVKFGNACLDAYWRLARKIISW
jgi:GT2 family glycosyltransferase